MHNIPRDSISNKTLFFATIFPTCRFAHKFTNLKDIFFQITEYEEQDLYPVDTVVEMRLVGSSDMLLAPYYGNEYGTISIEVHEKYLFSIARYYP